jgi:hypothetical protein
MQPHLRFDDRLVIVGASPKVQATASRAVRTSGDPQPVGLVAAIGLGVLLSTSTVARCSPPRSAAREASMPAVVALGHVSPEMTLGYAKLAARPCARPTRRPWTGRECGSPCRCWSGPCPGSRAEWSGCGRSCSRPAWPTAIALGSWSPAPAPKLGEGGYSKPRNAGYSSHGDLSRPKPSFAQSLG